MSAAAAASADWSSIGPGAHAVQFYPNDGYLLDLLTRFVGTALVAGDAAIVIATKPHRDGLAKRLRDRGFDIAVPRREGRYIALDAEATARRITDNGVLDRRLFREVIGNALTRASGAAAGRRVMAFGEIVSLLWADGKHESAVRVEELWNELAREHAFSLCCAYPISGFGHRHAAPFMKICAQHSHVFTVARAVDDHPRPRQP